MRIKKELYPWLFWLIPFFSLLLVRNTKIYLLVFLLFALYNFFFKKRSLLDTIYTIFLFSLPFERSIRSWLLTIVSHGLFSWEPGYNMYFGLSIKLLLSAVLFFLFLTSKKSSFRLYRHLPSDLLLLFLILSLFSSIFAFNLTWAMAGFVRIWLSLSIFFFTFHLLQSKRFKNEYFEKYFISQLLFFGFIGTIQFLKRQPIGLEMEDTSSFVPFGYVTTDGEAVYRAAGFTGHPTYFGSLLSALLPISLFYFLHSKKIINQFFSGLASILGLVSIIGTLSRSAWISLLIIVIVSTVYLYRRRFSGFETILKRYRVLFLPAILILLLSGSLILSRLSTFINLWSSGNGPGRLQLVDHSLQMVLNHPFLGVGLNHFTRYMMEQGVISEFRGFIFPVHNTILLFFSELGIPATLIFLTAVFSIIISSFKKSLRHPKLIGLTLAPLIFLFNAQFHTLFNQDPNFDIFMLALAVISAL